MQEYYIHISLHINIIFIYFSFTILRGECTSIGL